LRSFKWSKKFYAPKEYLTNEEQKEKPKSLPSTFWGWLGPLFSASQDEVIRTAGVDAAMYV
jgi:Late exocytosis, associated with Golgi transport